MGLTVMPYAKFMTPKFFWCNLIAWPADARAFFLSSTLGRKSLSTEGCNRITFWFSEDECRGVVWWGEEHLRRSVLPKQCIQLKETSVYFKNWCFPKMKFSGRVKPNIVSGLPVAQLQDAILHSSFYQKIQLKNQLGPTAYPSLK